MTIVFAVDVEHDACSGCSATSTVGVGSATAVALWSGAVLPERVKCLCAEEAATPIAGMAVVCDRVALDELPEAAATLPEEG